MKQILLFVTLFVACFAIISSPEHSNIIKANLVTAEHDIYELEKRIRVNEDRERTLKNQLRIHYSDLKVAANPTARVQLERGIESILSELRVLRAATRKFIAKMRDIANGIVGVERNEIIRKLRIERRLETEPEMKNVKIQRKAEKKVKQIAKQAAKKYGAIAAKNAGEKAAKEAVKKYGDDKQKIDMEKKKASRAIYKKAYKAIMSKVESATFGKPLKEFKKKAADTVLTLTRKDNIAVKVDEKKKKESVKKALTKVLNKKQLEEMKKQEKKEEKKKEKVAEPPKNKKSNEEKKQLEKVKEAKKEITKQKDKIKRQDIKMKKEMEKQKLNEGGLVAKKPAAKKPTANKMNPVRMNKRQIERVIYKANKGAKQIGLKPLKPQLTVRDPVPTPFDKAKTVEQLEKDRDAEIARAKKMGKNQKIEPMEPEFADAIPPEPISPIMGMEAQKAYMSSLFGMPVPPYMGNNYFVDPNEINAAYNELLM